ncbi:low molecular weight phosphotyrosine protein phosphatase [Nocardioides rotundus]|uniref:low molecular weight protein-tyrosine-phosphatase n=1 Tax=Nocardioides rotundus TaxID=1774216 RepID=UPI001CBB0479|nr:low molecular weight protein-tyrosine-phosphatase [Nocardioides rotundus]UAL30147.1 low molecular weight phosphotyrosine protein phosphatase [Nocardioides rotundus]
MTEPATAAQLPEPSEPGRYSVAFVCSGNICRSPSAEVVLRSMLAERGLEDRVEVASSGLGDWHVGDPMDPRSAEHLRSAGYDPDRHRAQQVQPDWLDDYDLLLAMDRGHVAGLAELGEGPVMLFRDFDPVGTGEDTPDPYYGGDSGFSEVLQMVERTCHHLATELERVLARPGS